MARPSRSARLVALVAATLATALVACSLLNGLDADYKLQAPGLIGEGGKDGEVDLDGPALDAPADAPTPIDGGGDGSMPTAFCASVEAGPNDFCWDFEKAAGATKWGWTDSLATRGSITVLDGIGVNSSKALRASITDPGAGSGQAYLRQVVGMAGSKFTDFRNHEMSFSYSITKGTPLYTAALGALGFGGSGNQYVGASIYASGATPGFVDVSDPPAGMAGTSIPVKLGEWRRVKIALERSGDAGPYAITVSIDGTAVEDVPPPFNAGASTMPTQAWVGTFFSAGGDGGVEAVIDNVLVRQWN